MAMKNDVLPHRSVNNLESELLGKLIPKDGKNKFESLVGHVAFAQYAVQKHQFVEQTKKEEGAEPSEERLCSLLFSFRPDNSNALSTLRSSSEQLLHNVAEEYAVESHAS